MESTPRLQQIQQLRKTRPRDLFLRGSLVAVAALVLYSLIAGDFSLDHIFSSKPKETFSRFWTYATEPDPPGSPREETRTEIRSYAFSATMITLWLSIAAMVLAGIGATLLSGLASRNLTYAQPFIDSPTPPSLTNRAFWSAINWLTRSFLIFTRAIPEYIWAFLLIGLFGLGAWPAVLALALHNLGILGRLGSETIDNQSNLTPTALRALGASRTKIYLHDLVPNSLPRWLVYFFYRWETCVREASILGMLGIGSLGYFIFKEARPRDLYDVMIEFTLLGAGLVLAADLLSALIRWRLRKIG